MHALTRVGVGYNAQIAVDTKHKLIAEAQILNKVSDKGLLTQTATAARDTLDADVIEVVADKGYYKLADVVACEAAGITPYVPKSEPGLSKSKGHYPKDRFRYDAERDVYICPSGYALSPSGSFEANGDKVKAYHNRGACKKCWSRHLCTDGKLRQIVRYDDEAVMEDMAARLAKRPEVLDARREAVEHPFGSIKQWMGQGAFLMKRLDNVRGEFSLTALAYNIHRAITAAIPVETTKRTQ